ncbi:hypothetical protein V5O48_015761, partial [Marasmius crinis-equi]
VVITTEKNDVDNGNRVEFISHSRKQQPKTHNRRRDAHCLSTFASEASSSNTPALFPKRPRDDEPERPRKKARLPPLSTAARGA